MKKFGQLLPEL